MEEETKNEDAEEEDKEEDDSQPSEYMHKYTVDLIANYKDFNEDLLLHWALGRNNPGEWTKPDDSFLPPNTVRWNDNVACQTSFSKSLVYPEFRSIQLTLKWIADVDPPCQAVNFVVLEKSKNWWHNNGG